MLKLKEYCKNCIHCSKFNVNSKDKPQYYYCDCFEYYWKNYDKFEASIIIKPKKMGGSKLCSRYEKIYKYKPKNMKEFKYPERND